MANIFKDKKILFLAPHTDDVELGCGATLARVIEECGNVYVAAFSTAKQSLPSNTPSNQLELEFRSAMDVYGVDTSHLFIYDYEVRKLNFSRQDVLENMIQ
jgi:LmbE family N-acetylglucosaminyl deacetylase